MSSKHRDSPWARLLAMPNDSPTKIIVVAVGVCLVCSILVSSAAVLLKPIQKQNEALGRQKEILKVAGLYQPGIDIVKTFQAIDMRYVDLQNGTYIDADVVPEQSPVPIPDDQDIAGIGESQRYLPVYLVRTNDTLDAVVLPLVGKGLWSTVHGFVALSADGNTVKAITFYDHAETPGLGGEISNPNWLAKWRGKNIVDSRGDMQLRVVKGRVDPASQQARYEVDGLSGATLTANGISNMIRYWLGEYGFGPYLARIRKPRTGRNDV
jgi:Na+-transporting NADH:ubiquinone oxidoreductase subunit C